MPSKLLTDPLVRNLTPHPNKQVDHYDSKIRGFGVRVSPQWTKSFFVWYRVGDDARRLTLGRYPTMSLAEARKRAQQALLEVASGKDPAAEKQRARAAYSGELFGALTDAFIENHAKRKTRLWADTERLLKREFVSQWERWPARDISRRGVANVLSAIVNRGSPSTANHALAVLRKMLNWAVEQGHLERSPCAGLGMPARAISRDRILSDGELARVWRAADEMGYPFGPMIQLLILTAQRRGEVVGLQWSEIDTKAMEWTLPNGRTKSARAHVVPLSGAAAELLAGLPRLHEVLVFPARGKDNPASGFSKWKRELDERSGVVDWRIHDLRRTAASGMAQLSVPPHIIERVLNHTTGTRVAWLRSIIATDTLPRCARRWSVGQSGLPPTRRPSRRKTRFRNRRVPRHRPNDRRRALRAREERRNVAIESKGGLIALFQQFPIYASRLRGMDHLAGYCVKRVGSRTSSPHLGSRENGERHA